MAVAITTVIRAPLEKLIRLNKTRADFAETFEELIESCNTGSRNIEELFEELVKLSRHLSEEQQRHVRENMVEQPLSDFGSRMSPGLMIQGLHFCAHPPKGCAISLPKTLGSWKT